MTLNDLEHFRDLLVERQEKVEQLLGSPLGADHEDINKARALLSQIREALVRVENHSFGCCEVCHGEVELHRLEVQPVRQICLGCISKAEQAQLEEELFLASKIHRALLPQAIGQIEGHEMAVQSMAAHIVGGDYYDVLPSRSNLSRIVVADVMGKGLPAGLIMSNVQGALRILAEEIESPGALVSRLNQWLCRNVPVTKFVSLVCVGIESGGGASSTMILANAGHCPPCIIRSGGAQEWLEPTGGVLGVHEGFEYRECRHQLHRGDILLLYTDGATDIEGRNGEMFGEHQLADFVTARRGEGLAIVLGDLQSEVKRYGVTPELSDDYTVLALRKL